MKLKITKLMENEDYRSGIKYELTRDTGVGIKETKASFLDGGEPEDNTLGRDWNDVFQIYPLIQEAFEAGKRGESFELLEEQAELDTF